MVSGTTLTRLNWFSKYQLTQNQLLLPRKKPEFTTWSNYNSQTPAGHDICEQKRCYFLSLFEKKETKYPGKSYSPTSFSCLPLFSLLLFCLIIKINNGNRTECSPIWSVIIWVINKIGRARSGSPICLITSVIRDQIGRLEDLLPINHNHYNFRENKINAFIFHCLMLQVCPILDNPLVRIVSGCCYGYCDKFCDCWIKLSALNMIGWCNCPISGIRLLPTVQFHYTALHDY